MWRFYSLNFAKIGVFGWWNCAGIFFPKSEVNHITPPKTNMTGWKIHHEWVDVFPIEKLKNVPVSHVSFQGCVGTNSWEVLVLGGALVQKFGSTRPICTKTTNTHIFVQDFWIPVLNPFSLRIYTKYLFFWSPKSGRCALFQNMAFSENLGKGLQAGEGQEGRDLGSSRICRGGAVLGRQGCIFRQGWTPESSKSQGRKHRNCWSKKVNTRFNSQRNPEATEGCVVLVNRMVIQGVQKLAQRLKEKPRQRPRQKQSQRPKRRRSQRPKRRRFVPSRTGFFGWGWNTVVFSNELWGIFFLGCALFTTAIWKRRCFFANRVIPNIILPKRPRRKRYVEQAQK